MMVDDEDEFVVVFVVVSVVVAVSCVVVVGCTDSVC